MDGGGRQERGEDAERGALGTAGDKEWACERIAGNAWAEKPKRLMKGDGIAGEKVCARNRSEGEDSTEMKSDRSRREVERAGPPPPWERERPTTRIRKRCKRGEAAKELESEDDQERRRTAGRNPERSRGGRTE